MKTGAGIFRKLIGLLLVFVSTLCAATETITFYHTDVLGSPVAATDAYGAVVWKATYQPFGDETKVGDVSSLNATGYAGHRLEADLNLVYMNARYYDPIVGRFYSVDPVGFDESNDMSFNRYAYANNNPYAYVDLNGESPSPLDVYDFSHDVGNLLVQEIVYFAAVVNGNPEVAQYAIEGMVDARMDAATSTAGLVSPVPGTGRAMKIASKVGKGGLTSFTRASEFGIQSYKDLKKLTKGTGLEAHHLVEQRFAKMLGVAPGDMASVALTKAEHQAFTNAWRQAIPYGHGTANATRDQVTNAARQIYKDHPDILKSLGL